MGGDKGEGEAFPLFTPSSILPRPRQQGGGIFDKGRRLSRQVSDAPRFNAGSFTNYHVLKSFVEDRYPLKAKMFLTH